MLAYQAGRAEYGDICHRAERQLIFGRLRVSCRLLAGGRLGTTRRTHMVALRSLTPTSAARPTRRPPDLMPLRALLGLISCSVVRTQAVEVLARSGRRGALMEPPFGGYAPLLVLAADVYHFMRLSRT